MKKIEIIISTLNDGIYNIDIDIACESYPLLIVHQINNGIKYNYDIFDNEFITIIPSDTVGLSKSRNIGLKNSISDYLIMADDDLIFNSNNLDKIYDRFTMGADLVTFKVLNNNNKPFRAYNLSGGVIELSKNNFCSCELALKRSLFDNVSYDEHFGLGSKFPGFEELILLYDIARKKNVSAYFIDEFLIIHNDNTHTSLNLNKNYFIAYGAYLKRVNKKMILLRIVKFSLGSLIKKKSLKIFILSFIYTLKGFFQFKNN